MTGSATRKPPLWAGSFTNCLIYVSSCTASIPNGFTAWGPSAQGAPVRRDQPSANGAAPYQAATAFND